MTKKRTAPQVKPLMATGAIQNNVTTVAGDYTQLNSSYANDVVFYTENKSIRVIQRDENSKEDNVNYIVIPANTVHKMSGIIDSNELWVKADDNTVVTVRYRVTW